MKGKPKRPFRNMPKKRAAEIVEGKATIEKSTIFGPYTLVELSFKTKTGDIIVGHGVARRNPLDINNAEIGRNRAISHAIKGIVAKGKGRTPNHPLRA